MEIGLIINLQRPRLLIVKSQIFYRVQNKIRNIRVTTKQRNTLLRNKLSGILSKDMVHLKLFQTDRLSKSRSDNM